MGTDPASVTTHSTYIRDPFVSQGKDLWKPCQGPFTLLGDAAHPMRPRQWDRNGHRRRRGACLLREGFRGDRRRLQGVRIQEDSKSCCGRSKIPNGSDAVLRRDSREAAKLEVAALPAYPRVVNFDKDMEYDDWLHDIQWPNLTNTPQVL